METDVPSLFWFLVPGFVLPALFVALAFRAPSARQLRRWADASRVTITPANEALVRAHLGRVRRFRAVAAFPFWWLGTVRVVFSSFPSELATYAVPLLMYVAGALVAELTITPERSPAVKQASLTPRAVRDYQPDWIRVLPPAVLVLTALLLVAPSDIVGVGVGGRGGGGAVLGLVLATAILALSRVVAERVARRPQRAGDLDVFAADDGLCATAISMTTSIAVVASVTAFFPVAATVGIGSSTIVVAAMVVTLPLHLLAFGCLWCIVRQETWGYRRRHRQLTMADVS